MTTITLYEGDDYCIIWKDDEQIFCYHGGIERCVREVCKALGVKFEDADAEDGEFSWGAVTGKTLAEFNGEVREWRAKQASQEIQDLEAKLTAKKKALAAIKKS